MLLAFLRARFRHMEVMSAVRKEPIAQRVIDECVANLQMKLQQYKLGLAESTDILEYLSSCGLSAET